MGYKRNKVYKLVFADQDMEGLEIRVRAASVADMIEASKYTGIRISSEKIPALCDLMASKIIDWNLEYPDEDSDEIMPISGASITAQDLGFAKNVLDAWLDTVVGVPTPLDQPSTDGEQSVEHSIPMEIESVNPPS